MRKSTTMLACSLSLSLPPYSNLPPSQGGRYTGFGNTVQKPQKQESDTFSSAWDSLSSGWSSFTSSASTWATTAKEKASQLGTTINDNVLKPSSQQVCVYVCVCVCMHASVCTCVDVCVYTSMGGCIYHRDMIHLPLFLFHSFRLPSLATTSATM